MITTAANQKEEMHLRKRSSYSNALVCRSVYRTRLALAELELFTLAHLNGVIYYFWWNKPLCVNKPVKVYLKGAEPPEKVIEQKLLARLDLNWQPPSFKAQPLPEVHLDPLHQLRPSIANLSFFVSDQQIHST